MGCRVFEGVVEGWESAISGAGFKVEVFNVLGAGDAFMAGLLRGWLRGEDWQTSSSYANACGAFAVSRHGCAPAYASETELQDFMKNGGECEALRFDPHLNHIHRATNRRKNYSRLVAFAFDHRHQFDPPVKDLHSHRDTGHRRLELHRGGCHVANHHPHCLHTLRSRYRLDGLPDVTGSEVGEAGATNTGSVIFV